jgi:hypothetical protein
LPVTNAKPFGVPDVAAVLANRNPPVAVEMMSVE